MQGSSQAQLIDHDCSIAHPLSSILKASVHLTDPTVTKSTHSEHICLRGEEKNMGIYRNDHTAAMLLDTQAKYSTDSFAYRKERMRGIIFAGFYANQ